MSVEEEEVTAASLTTDAEEPTDDEEEDTNAEEAAAADSTEEPAEEEAAAEDPTEEPATEAAAAEESTEESATDEAAAEESTEESAGEETTEEAASEDEAAAEVTAQADGTSGQCGDDVYWDLDEETGVLTISGTGDMYDYAHIEDDGDYGTAPWYSYHESITAAVIEDGVTSIGDFAFFGCGSLESLTIPDSVTSIGYYAFQAAGLTSITIGSGVTWIAEDGVFDTESLTEINVDESNTVYCSVDGVLFDKDMTTLIAYPRGKTDTTYAVPDGVTSISRSAFYQSGLTDVTIPGSVTSIGEYAFSECNNLETVIYNGTMAEFAAIEVGKGNSCLMNLTIHCTDGDATNDDYVDNADDGENEDEEEDYSVGNGVEYRLEDGVLTIYRTDEEDQDGRMWDWDDGDSPFAWRDDITSIVIEDGVTYIGNNAFHGCSVESLYLGTDVEDIDFGEGAFVWCTELSSIEVSEDNGTYATQDGVLFQKDDEGNLSELKLYPVGDESRTSYEIPDGVWYIEQWAFFHADSLESVTISYDVTDIGYEAFKNCYSLMSVTVPDTVTYIGDRAFGWGDSDEGDLVTLDGFILYGYANTQAQWYAEDNGVTFEVLNDENAEGEGDFGEDGDNLHWVLADGVLTISVNEGCDNGWMGEMSRGDAPWYDMRHSIDTVIIEDGVEHIGNYAFYTCTNLGEVSVPDSVTDVGDWVFAQCPNLGSVELSNSVGWIGYYTFYRSGLNTFTIPNNSGLTEICDGTFQGTNLESISIPRRITSIGYAAFQDCGNLSEVTFSGTSKLSYIGDSAFQNCSSLTNIDIPSGVTTIEDWAFQGCSALESVTLPDDEDFTRVPSGMFSDCESLTSVTIPDSVTEIGNDAFANCTSLESVNIPDGVDYIYSWTFYNCSSLESITLPDGVTGIDDEAFRDCSSLTSINMPESLTRICWAAFADCSSLESITLPDGVTVIEDEAFRDCSSLTSINMPESLTQIWGAAFEGCSSLSGDLVIPDSVTEIGGEAFYGCSSLTSVTLPSNEEYTGISERTFQYCSGLTSVTIPDTVTSIGGSAFEGCTSLEYIEIPDSVDNIEWWAFAYCPLTGLEDDTLVINENVYNVGDNAFYGCGFHNVIIYSTEIDLGGGAFGWDGDDEEAYGTIDGFTVYGYSDTSAQWYADDNDLTFVGLDWEYEGQCGDNVYWTIENGTLTLYTEGEAEDEEQNGRMWDYDDWDDSPFGGRSDIKSIVVSDGVTYIGNGAFQNCYNLESLYLGADVNDISFGGGAFVWCTSLSSIEVSENNETFYTVDDVLFRDEGYTLCLYPSCKEGDSYTVPDGVGYIEQWAFYH
ncbi:MAG: leucine-rich repeat domain-containing protein, partial [Clostridiales bacterium]|nr:leucine-rich repeat domain-containing protein [Clostridiales bacterium]